MTKSLFWTKTMLDTFIKEANLNARQEYIIRTRAKGYYIAKQAEELHLSIDQVNKDIAELKKIYDYIQSTSDVLPPRCKNKQELFKQKNK